MTKFWSSVTKVNHNYYSFLSGVMISISLEIYIELFSGETIPNNWFLSLGIAILSFISALNWSIIAWTLASIQNLVYKESPDFMNVDEIWSKVISKKLPTIKKLFWAAIISLLIGILFFPLKIIF